LSIGAGNIIFAKDMADGGIPMRVSKEKGTGNPSKDLENQNNLEKEGRQEDKERMMTLTISMRISLRCLTSASVRASFSLKPG